MWTQLYDFHVFWYQVDYGIQHDLGPVGGHWKGEMPALHLPAITVSGQSEHIVSQGLAQYEYLLMILLPSPS